jgi:uncharacterized protein (UPF0335 family)
MKAKVLVKVVNTGRRIFTMTNKEKIAILKQYRIMLLEYRVRNNYYLQLRDKLMYPAPEIQKLSDMPVHHSVSNQLENNYIKLESLEAEMQQRVSDILDILKRLERAIGDVHDSLLRTILAMKYLEGMKLENICCEVNYSWRSVRRLHAKAVTILKL